MTTATRPVLSDRHRTILAAVHVLGTPSAAGAHLGITPLAVDAVMGRAGRTLGVPAREVVRQAHRLGLLEDAPPTIPIPRNPPRRVVRTVPRGDGTVWAPRRAPHVVVWAEGCNLLVLRCGDVQMARKVVARRWAEMHGGEPPATGRIVWRRPEAVPTRSGGSRYEPADPVWSRSFPAVLFTPEGATL